MKRYLTSWLPSFISLWVISIPFQIYFNAGISYSVSILLFILLLLSVVFLNLFDKDFTVKNVIKRYWIIFSVLGFIVVSTLLNINSSVKEMLRWAVFFIELIVLLEFLRLKIVTVSKLATVFIVSVLILIFLSSYQLFISQETELKLTENYIGKIFNDPDLIAERINGVGKYNWIYGDSIRVHGFFANVSQFSLFIGIAILLLYSDIVKFKVPLKVIIGGVLTAFLVLTLVRTSFIALLFIIVLTIFYSYLSNKEKSMAFYLFISFTFGIAISIFLSLFSYNRFIYDSLIVRFIETITLDGALMNNQFVMFKETFERVSISSGEFNEYGGVGGRYNLWKLTIYEIVLQRVQDVKFLLFGIGPGSIGLELKSISNDYFSRFNSIDNSILQWFVELGAAVFIFLTCLVYYYWTRIRQILQKYWRPILFIGINSLFMNILPDLRMGMLLSVVLAIIFHNGNEY